MGRARKGCKFCDMRRKDWEWQKLPVDLGIFGDYTLNVWVLGYKKQLVVDLEPEKTEAIWEKRIIIEYCPFCGTNLNALKREV